MFRVDLETDIAYWRRGRQDAQRFAFEFSLEIGSPWPSRRTTSHVDAFTFRHKIEAQ